MSVTTTITRFLHMYLKKDPVMKNKIISFGEIMLRLTPPDKQLIVQTSSFDGCYGGSEANVLVCLSCLGDKTDYLTALPKNDLGLAVIRHLNSFGVGTDNIIRQGERLGMYFLSESAGERPAAVIYNRKDSEVSKLDEGAFNCDEIFKDCSIFHISGISFAISESSKRLCFELIKAAKERGILVSFDFNYRSKLWTIPQASETYKEILPYIDIVFASQKDLDVFVESDIENFFKRYRCKTVFLREKIIDKLGNGTVSVTVAHKDANDTLTVYPKQTTQFTVLERIGSGDAFAGGVLHVLNKNPHDVVSAVQCGITCFVLKHGIKGDAFTMGTDSILLFNNNFSKDVVR